MAYAPQKPFKKELEWFQEQAIITPLGVDDTAEWCNSFVMVPIPNGIVRLCLDLTRLNQALIRLVHRGSTLNHILPNLNNVQYLSLIDGGSDYHNLKLDKRSSYLTIFACQFGRNRSKRLPFGAAPVGDMFQRKMDEIFKDLPNVFGIAGDILVKGYNADGKDHDDTLQTVQQRCRQVNLNLNKDKCHFRCTSVPFFSDIIFRYGINLTDRSSRH